MKPVVCHFNNQFFIGSQTFIYNYVSNYHEYRPVLLAREFLNLEQFPFNPADRYLIRFKQYTPRWLINGLYRKWFGIEWATEKVIRKCKGCLIHAHFGDNGFRILNIKMRLGLPLVTTFYGYDLSQLPGISDELAA
ncbi:MAG: hypothetical protein O7E52_14490, partial [Candidatus Poribacteria bacterium]|nr:hypothetical protein [Candidatus Poribacteria bacterium]